MKKKPFNLPLIGIEKPETSCQTSLQDLFDAIRNESRIISKKRDVNMSHLYEIMDEIDNLNREINEIDRELAKKYYFN